MISEIFQNVFVYVWKHWYFVQEKRNMKDRKEAVWKQKSLAALWKDKYFMKSLTYDQFHGLKKCVWKEF